MKRICIIGAGWLGAELAKSLKAKGFYVIGTTRNSVKYKAIQGDFNKLFLFDFTESYLFPPIKIDVIVFTIPPSTTDLFIKHAFYLLTHIQKVNPEVECIYTSSISVYGNTEGLVTEDSPLQPETDNSLKIVKLEKFISEEFQKYSILRLGGLVGGARHPVKFLQGKLKVKKPYSPVNLLHRYDAVGFIVSLIVKKKRGIYNLCSPSHPTKKEFYSALVEQFDLKSIIFNESDKQIGKIVTCKTVEQSGFEFKYQSVYNFPFEI